MIQREQLDKLTSFIEENTRTSKLSGITYIDPRNFKSRVVLKQNHVIFGRRGAGKSSLIKTISNDTYSKYYVSYTNLEDFKDISFPNILIHVLESFYSQVKKQIKKEYGLLDFKTRFRARKALKEIDNSFYDFKNQIPNPDLYEEDIREKTGASGEAQVGLNANGVKAGVKKTQTSKLEIAKKISRDKLESIKNAIPKLKNSIKAIDEFTSGKPIYLIFDDFYFLKKTTQVFFLDFFHRLTKDTGLFLKVATIKHRSKLYSQLENSYYGTELGHDIQEIDLDYNLDRFEELKSFMTSLLNECSKLAKVSFDINELFTDNAFSQLCLASGGVPRDFLTLFVKLAGIYNPDTGKRIGKLDIIEVAIQNINNKYASLKTDSAEEKELLETYLSQIKEQILINKKTNMFLVSNADIDKYPEMKQAVRELVDLRMLHLVEPNTSSSGGKSGQRYSAYIIDTGLYPNSFQLNFKQQEPGITDSEGRKDEMRGSPKLELNKISDFIKNKAFSVRLELTDE